MKTKKKGFTKNGTFFPQVQVKKIRSSPKMKYFFSRNSSGLLRSDAHQSQIIGGCRCRPYSNYWGDTAKLLGDISPRGFGTPGRYPCPWSSSYQEITQACRFWLRFCWCSRLFLERLIPIKNFARVANYKQNFNKLQHICNFQWVFSTKLLSQLSEASESKISSFSRKFKATF